MIRVLVVDDHELFRSGVCSEVGGVVDIVGGAADVHSATEAIRSLLPEVVLLDVRLPGGGGRRVIEHVLPTFPQVRFLALSASDSAADVVDVVRAGARGYITKAITGTELCRAITCVHAGDVYFSPSLAGLALDAFGAAPAASSDPNLDKLTRRERDVLRLIAAGYTYQEAATRLYISRRTVETHAAAVLRKLRLSSRRELTRWMTGRDIG